MAVSQSLSVTEVAGSVNGSANTSKVRILWTSTQSGDSRNEYTRTARYYVSINGGAEITYNVSYTLPQNTTKTIVDTTITVTHKDDGTGSVKVRTWMDTSISAGEIEKSQSLTLTTIARASTITSVADRTLGTACSVKWTPLSNTFRYKLKFSIGDFSYTTGAIHPNTTSAYTYTGYSLPIADIAPKITSKPPTGTMTVTLYTYSDSNATVQVGSASSTTFKVTVPDNTVTKPSISMSLASVNSLASKFSSLYIQGKSKVEASITGTGKYSANVTSYEMYADGKSNGTLQSDYLSKAGNITIKGRVYDSRGFYNEAEQVINVIPYSKPTLQNISGERGVICARCDASGVLSDSGTYLRIKAQRSYNKVVSDGVQKNFCLVRYRYKTANASAYSPYTTILAKESTSSDVVDVVLGNIVSSATTSYMVELSVADDIEEGTPLTFVIPTEEVFLHKAGSIGSLGIGEYVEEADTISIAKNKHINMKSSLNGVRMRSRFISGTADIDIKTKYSNFTGNGQERQSFFVFGDDNGKLIYGVARVSNAGATLWSGTDGVTLKTKDGGVLTIVLPAPAYDHFTIISGQEFTM